MMSAPDLNGPFLRQLAAKIRPKDADGAATETYCGLVLLSHGRREFYFVRLALSEP